MKFSASEIRRRFDVLRVVFPSDAMYRVAKLLVRELKRYGELPDFAHVPDIYGVPKSTTYYVLREMLRLGMIERTDGGYRLSREFSNALIRIARAWTRLISDAKHGDE